MCAGEEKSFPCLLFQGEKINKKYENLKGVIIFMPPEPEGCISSVSHLLCGFLPLGTGASYSAVSQASSGASHAIESAQGGAVEAVSQSAGNPLFSILLLVVLILLNAFFAASELAVISLNDNRIKKMAEEGNKKARRILRLTQNSSRFLSTIQIGVTLAGFLTSASAAESFSDPLADVLASFIPISREVLDGISTVLITLLLSYFSLVFGELVPKKIAIQNPEKFSFRAVGILQGVSVLFRPLISLLTASTNLVLRILGIDPNKEEDTVTEEEILMMVDAGEEKGVIDEEAKDMISNIFDFHDTTVVEAMTHRTDIGAVEDTASISEVVELSLKEGHSRIPVYHEDLDNIIGVIYVKDLLKFVGTPAENVDITKLMRSAYFIPESKACSDLFTEMTERKLTIAIIVDEYGGTEGLITMEDLLESIVGNIQDEFDHEEEEIRKVSDNSFTVDGTTPIDEIEDLTGVEIPESDYDTIAGLMMERLGRIPSEGEHPTADIGRLHLTVEAVEERRISRILIEKEPLPPEELVDDWEAEEKEKGK